MLKDEIIKIRQLALNKKPLIHCITNPISINQCANVILAAGGRPVMAEHPKEVYEISKTASAVVLNTGNITDARMEALKTSAKCCKEKGIPFVLDAVGSACSTLRREYIKKLLDEAPANLIKGNYSEIKALYDKDYISPGVDSENIDIFEIADISKRLSQKYKAVVLASGKTDVITDGKKLFFIHNGTKRLSEVTGTGCMLGALCGLFMAVGEAGEAAVLASAVMGIAGELSEKEKGNASFLISLIDHISMLSSLEIEKMLKMEEIKIED